MRIGVISYHTSPLAKPGIGDAGGMNMTIYNLFKRLGRNCDSDIVTSGERNYIKIQDNLRVIYINESRIKNFADAVIAHHEKNRYDLIHTHYWLSGLVGLEIKKRVAIPWVHTFHTIERFKGLIKDSGRVEVEESILHHSDLIISPTQIETKRIRESYPKARVGVIPHGVDVRRFQPSPNGHKALLYVGRIDPLKGLDILIEAIMELKSELRVDVVGGPSKDNNYHDSLKQMAKGQNIRFLGQVDHSQLPKYYRDAGVVVLPSHYESFGLVGLEAMASARPVIGFEGTGLAETVGRDGGLLIPKSLNGLKKAISLFANNQELRHRVGEKGRRKALRLNWDGVSRRYLKTYAEITKG